MGKKLKHLFEITKWLFLIIFSLCLVGCGGISDGEYTASVVMTGGSGKAYIESPCKVTITDGQATAHLVWSSPNYDYMIVDGDTYYPVNKEGNSEFDIPVTLGKEMNVQARPIAVPGCFATLISDSSKTGFPKYSNKSFESIRYFV